MKNQRIKLEAEKLKILKKMLKVQQIDTTKVEEI